MHAGAVLTHQPVTQADAEATVRDLITLGADFEAGPLAISGRNFATYGVTPASVFDVCALSHVDDGANGTLVADTPTVSNVAAMVRRAFGARVTDTIRPMNANYGARYSWHKVGQAVDFVPAGGVGSIDRDQIRALMAQSGIRIIELLGPGDRGHSNHWHVAFARPGQIIDRTRPIEGDEDWLLTVAQGDGPSSPPVRVQAPAAPASALASAAKASPPWDVFATEEWRAAHGGGS
ncbi:muramidase [Sphingomonas sp. RB3P16]|uniref:muramidase n=1 Tax=Parasphingomonas frigoris TaxID=3096163 RepID=UPI002FC7518C